VSRDQLLGRARRAVLAVAATAGGLGGRAKRRQADDSHPSGRAATPGLPPRIEHEREPGMPPVQPAHASTPGLPPRLEREQPVAGLPPRIERSGGPAVPPRIERPAEPRPRIEREPDLPPRIEREPDPAPPPAPDPPPRPADPPPAPPVALEDADAQPAATRPPEPAVEVGPEPAYEPLHGRTAVSEAEPETAGEAADGLQPAPAPARVREDPLASPVKNVLRSHSRLAYILAAVIVIAAAGYWAVRVHQRIGEGSLEAGIAKQQHAPTVQCASLKQNGSAWACAVVYQAESVCFIARVNLLGSWSTVTGQHRCARIPRLARLVPTTITASMVGDDIDRRTGATDFVCGKLPSHKVRWACERPLATGGQCLVVRVIQWTSWNVLDGGKTCAHDPDLQRALRRARSST
jgi:hypothetical protein